MTLRTEPQFLELLQYQPGPLKASYTEIRDLVHEVAHSLDEVQELQEVLRWGQLSFVAETGSTFRLGIDKKDTKNFRLYFQCTSRLIPTFRSVFGDHLSYEKNRALLFKIGEPLSKELLGQIIRTALVYHLLKKQPLLGL